MCRKVCNNLNDLGMTCNCVRLIYGLVRDQPDQLRLLCKPIVLHAHALPARLFSAS
jgi:hypothetical protein